MASLIHCMMFYISEVGLFLPVNLEFKPLSSLNQLSNSHVDLSGDGLTRLIGLLVSLELYVPHWEGSS